MKKIMFNDQFGLTQAVLEGRKTQTRRVIHLPKGCNGVNAILLPNDTFSYFTKPGAPAAIVDGVYCHSFYKPCVPPYFIGEELAIAQSYKDANYIKPYGPEKVSELMNTPGWNNKMFVKPELMPHRIRITNIRIEQVGDITNGDALLEGIKSVDPKEQGIARAVYVYGRKDEYKYETPRSAFLGLCCHLRLPQTALVFVYDFVLVD